MEMGLHNPAPMLVNLWLEMQGLQEKGQRNPAQAWQKALGSRWHWSQESEGGEQFPGRDSRDDAEDGDGAKLISEQWDLRKVVTYDGRMLVNSELWLSGES